MTFITLYAVILLPIISLVATIISFWSFEVDFEVDNPFLVKKEETDLTVRIANKSLLAFYGVKFKCYDGYFSREEKVDLQAMSTFEKKYEIGFSYRGKYELTLSEIEFTDPLGLFKFRKNVLKKIEINVYPRIIELEDLKIVKALVSYADAKVMLTEDDFTTISDVRKYVDTDSYKKIHWKLSAKRNELIVKNFQSQTGDRVSLLLDINSANIAVEDEMVEMMVSYADSLLKNNIHIELAYWREGFVRKEANDASDFHHIYQTIAELEFCKSIDMENVLFDYVREQDDFCTIVVFASRISPELCDAILATQASSYKVMFIFFAKNGMLKFESEFLSSLTQSGVICIEKIC